MNPLTDDDRGLPIITAEEWDVLKKIPGVMNYTKQASAALDAYHEIRLALIKEDADREELLNKKPWWKRL